MAQEQRPNGQEQRPRPPVEIYVYATNKNFLNLYDALRINKIKIELASYDQASGRQTGIASAWLDTDDLKLLIHLVISRQFKDTLIAPTQTPGKFESFGGSTRKDGQLESRTLIIEYDDQGGKFARYPYRLTISNGPGKSTQNGAIQPAGEPTSRVQMRVPESDFMKVLLMARDYVQAYEQINHNRVVAEKTRELRERLEARDNAAAPGSAPVADQREEQRPAPAPRVMDRRPVEAETPLPSRERSGEGEQPAPSSKVTPIRAARPAPAAESLPATGTEGRSRR